MHPAVHGREAVILVAVFIPVVVVTVIAFIANLREVKRSSGDA